MAEISFRFAKKGDGELVLNFIKGLAAYENMSERVVATPSLLEEWLFEKGTAKVLIGSADGADVGFALFFDNFSTFLGRAGIYLEDLFVLPEHRGKGYGKAFLKKLASIAVESGRGRLDWACLDWNKSSIDFYKAMGAEALDDWTTYRLEGETLLRMAEK